NVGRRLGAARLEIVGQHEAIGFGERYFIGRQRLRLGQHLLQRSRNRQQRHDQDPFARKWPLLPPLFSTSRMPSMRMPRSTALTMSWMVRQATDTAVSA